MPNHSAQFDFIAIAQKTRQRRINQQRLGYFHRLRRIRSELIRLRLADGHDAIRGQIIRSDEFKSDLAVSVSFQTALPIRQCAKLFADIFDVRDRFLAAVADRESFLRQTELGKTIDVTVERLVSAHGKRISRIKFLADRR